MKKIITLLLGIVIMVLFTNDLFAQAKAITRITSVKQKGETVWFKLTSSKPLIFGSNRYVLYIGEKEFTDSDVPSDENNKNISFPVSKNEFNAFKEGADMYVSYGRINIRAHDMEKFAKENRKCWALGKFSKTMLKK